MRVPRFESQFQLLTIPFTYTGTRPELIQTLGGSSDVLNGWVPVPGQTWTELLDTSFGPALAIVGICGSESMYGSFVSLCLISQIR